MAAYTDGIAESVLVEKMRLTLAALFSEAGDNDEALDTSGREPSALSHGLGFEVTAPAWLSFYNSSGTDAPVHREAIDSHEQAQAQEWARQHPSRGDLFDSASDDNCKWQSEAQEWLDVALEGESLFYNLEIERSGDDVTLRAGFGDEINAPKGPQFMAESSVADFMAMDDNALEQWAAGALSKPYEALTES